MKFSHNPEIDLLKRLKTLAGFDDQQLQTLASRIRMQTVDTGEKIIATGCAEKYYLYLLKGEVEVLANDGKTSTVRRKLTQSDIIDDLTPIARIRPSLYDVVAVTKSTILRIYNEQLKEVTEQNYRDDFEDKSILKASDEIEDTDFTSILLQQFQEENKLTVELFFDLTTGAIKLPSLPDIAAKIEQAYKSNRFDPKQIAKIIQTDPAITAKLIMFANSSIYADKPKIATLSEAIKRLGSITCRKQVMIYAVNELFQEKSDGLSEQLQALCLHSQKVASISRIIAEKTGLFDPDMAHLTGLIHDLGVIAIIQYYQETSTTEIDFDILYETVEHLHSHVTSQILEKWQFSQDIITAAEESEDWYRKHENEADLCDLIIIAKYHSFIGTDNMPNMPPILNLPALHKLKLDDLGPVGSLDIIRKSKQEMKNIRQLLSTV